MASFSEETKRRVEDAAQALGYPAEVILADTQRVLTPGGHGA